MRVVRTFGAGCGGDEDHGACRGRFASHGLSRQLMRLTSDQMTYAPIIGALTTAAEMAKRVKKSFAN